MRVANWKRDISKIEVFECAIIMKNMQIFCENCSTEKVIKWGNENDTFL